MPTLLTFDIGPGGDYATMSAFIGGEVSGRDLVSEDVVVRAHVHPMQDTTRVSAFSATTDETRRVEIIDPLGPLSGVWDTDRYRLMPEEFSGVLMPQCHLLLRHVQIMNTRSTSHISAAVQIGTVPAGGMTVEVDSCILRGPGSGQDHGTPWPVQWIARKKGLVAREVRATDRSMGEDGRTVHLDRLVQHEGGWLRYGLGRRTVYWRRE